MPDPVLQAAEEMAPAPAETSFFSGNAGPVFRSAMAGRRLEDQRVLGEEISGLSRSRLDRRLQRRQEVLWDRDEQEYQDKQAFKASRGEFLSTISLLDPTKDDYRQKRSDLVASLPPEALADDAVQAILRYTDDRAEQTLRQREEEEKSRRAVELASREIYQKTEAELFKLGMTDEEYNQMVKEAGGAPDVRTLYREIFRREDAAKKAEFQQELALKADKSEPLTEWKLKIETTTEDREAFPRRAVQDLLAKFKKDGPKDTEKSLENLKKKWPAEYEAAEAADKRGPEEIMAAALRTPKEEDFVDVPGISAAGRAARRKVWRMVHQRLGEDAAPGARAAGAAGARAAGARAAGTSAEDSDVGATDVDVTF